MANVTIPELAAVTSLLGGEPFETVQNGVSVQTAIETMLAYGGPDGNDSYRERLTAARTYYVRTDGSDDNTGLANAAGGAWLTLQHAVDTISTTLDFAGYTVTLQVGDGTYAAGATFTNMLVGAAAQLRIVGNTTTPASCVINSATDIFRASTAISVSINGFKLVTTGNYSIIAAVQGSVITVGSAMEFGAAALAHLGSFVGAVISASGYTVSGGASAHWLVQRGNLTISGVVTVTGTPAFTSAFAQVNLSGFVQALGTFAGSATGTRYIVNGNSVLNANGAGATFLPGDAAGTTGTGGQYL